MDDLDFSASDTNLLNKFIHDQPKMIPHILEKIKTLSVQHQEYVLLNCDLLNAISLCPEFVPALLTALHQCPHSAIAFQKTNEGLLTACKSNQELVKVFLKELLKYSEYEQRKTIIHLHECHRNAIKHILEHLSLFPIHVQQQTLLERDKHQHSTLMKVIMTAPEAVEAYLKLLYNSPLFQSIITYKKIDAEHHKSFTALNIAKKYFLDLRDEMAYSILLAYHHLAFHHVLREQYVNMVLNLPNTNYGQLKQDYVMLYLLQQIEKIEDELIKQNLYDCVNEYKNTGDYNTFINNYHALLEQLPIQSSQQFLFFKTYSHKDKFIIQLIAFIENHAQIEDNKVVRLIKPHE